MNDNTFWAFVLLLCFFSCEGCPGRKIIDAATRQCAEQAK